MLNNNTVRYYREKLQSGVENVPDMSIEDRDILVSKVEEILKNFSDSMPQLPDNFFKIDRSVRILCRQEGIPHTEIVKQILDKPVLLFEVHDINVTMAPPSKEEPVVARVKKDKKPVKASSPKEKAAPTAPKEKSARRKAVRTDAPISEKFVPAPFKRTLADDIISNGLFIARRARILPSRSNGFNVVAGLEISEINKKLRSRTLEGVEKYVAPGKSFPNNLSQLFVSAGIAINNGQEIIPAPVKDLIKLEATFR